MPQRFLRPGITNSERWNLAGWQAQSFYIRLVTLVDDFGRYEANFALLRGHAFALREEVKTEKVKDLCIELYRCGLANFFEQNGKQYLQLLNWQENARSNKSKYPEFDNTCTQMFSDVSKPLAFDSTCVASSSSSSPQSSSSSSPIVIESFLLSELGGRISKWFGRKPETRWSAKELKALKSVEALNPSDSDILILEAYYQSDAKFKRRDIATLLNNWNGEIDRAKDFRRDPSSYLESANNPKPAGFFRPGFGQPSLADREAAKNLRAIQRSVSKIEEYEYQVDKG